MFVLDWLCCCFRFLILVLGFLGFAFVLGLWCLGFGVWLFVFCVLVVCLVCLGIDVLSVSMF